MACNDTSGIVPITSGRTRIKGLDLNFTSLTEITKTFSFGNDIIDAQTNQPIQLPGKPSFSTAELTTPRTHEALKKVRTWIESKDSCPGKVSFTTVIDNQYFTHSGCSLLSYTLNPGHDANADQTTATFIRISLSINNQSVNQLETRKEGLFGIGVGGL